MGKALAWHLGHPPVEQRGQAGAPASWGEEHYPEGSPKHSREVGHGLRDSSRSTTGGPRWEGHPKARAVTLSTWLPLLSLQGQPAEHRPQAAEGHEGRERGYRSRPVKNGSTEPS